MPRRKRRRKQREPLRPGARVFAYCRDSGGNQQETSTVDQAQAIREYCAKNTFDINGWYVDEATSARDIEHRDALHRLMADARKEPPAAVIMWSTSRWARDVDDAQLYRAELRTLGVRVLSITEPLPDGPEGRLLETIIDWTNQRQIEQMSRDIQRGLQANIRRGYIPGRLPAGYKREYETAGHRRDGTPHRLARPVIDPEKGPKIAEAFRLRAAGYSYGQIEKAVRLGYTFPGYMGLFRNAAYIGVYRHGDLEVPNSYPPLVDEETWQQVQARARVKTTRPWADKSPYLLSGLLRCNNDHSMSGGSADLRSLAACGTIGAQLTLYGRNAFVMCRRFGSAMPIKPYLIGSLR